MNYSEFENKYACGCDFGGTRLPSPHYAVECSPESYDRAEFLLERANLAD